jgi:DNA-binding XRE family transcriptional regulator
LQWHRYIGERLGIDVSISTVYFALVKRRSAKARRTASSPVHDRIAELRKGRGLTQEALADELGVKKAAVSHWETGQGRPEAIKLPDLASLLGTTVDDLIEGDSEYEALREAFAS